MADAFGAAAAARVAVLVSLNQQIAELERELGEHFDRHPDAEILRSLPGLGPVLGARVLGEFGDDPNRYADARGRKAYAGTAPITKASGRSLVVLARVARNRRLADACERWAFCSLNASPGARRYYDALRARGKTHSQATRQLANRWVGILHACLERRQTYRRRSPGRRGRSGSSLDSSSRGMSRRFRQARRLPTATPAGEATEAMEAIALEPVDAITVTTLVDNVTDSLLADQGPAKRPSMAAAPRMPAPLLAGGDTDDALRAEHGFSALVTIAKGDRETRVLFDAGRTPDGLVENMRRLGPVPRATSTSSCSATVIGITSRAWTGWWANSGARTCPS